MFDGLKIICEPTPANFGGDGLDFILSVNEQTGNVSNTKRAFCDGLRFDAMGNNEISYCSVTGSIHKYKNHGEHNNDKFYYDDVCKTIENLHNRFSINPQTSKMIKLEFGVNIIMKERPQNIINKAIFHHGKPFVPLSRKDHLLGAICSHDDYEIKLYDKGFGKSINNGYMLRIELRILKSRVLHDLGINFLSDLTNIDNWETCKALLMSRIKEIIFVDMNPKKLAPLTPKEKELYLSVSNSLFWETATKKIAYRARQRYNALTEKYEYPNIGNILACRISKEVAFLETKSDERKKRVLGTFSMLEYIREKVPARGLYGNKKNTPQRVSNINHNNNINTVLECKENRFTIRAPQKINKTMEIKKKNVSYLIVTYGKFKESVKLHPSEITAYAKDIKTISSVQDLNTGKVYNGILARKKIAKIAKDNLRKISLTKKMDIRNLHARVVLSMVGNGLSYQEMIQSLGFTKPGQMVTYLRNSDLNIRQARYYLRLKRIQQYLKNKLTPWEMALNERCTVHTIRHILKLIERGEPLSRSIKHFKYAEKTRPIDGKDLVKMVTESNNKTIYHEPIPRGRSKERDKLIIDLLHNGLTVVDISNKIGIQPRYIYRRIGKIAYQSRAKWL